MLINNILKVAVIVWLTSVVTFNIGCSVKPKKNVTTNNNCLQREVNLYNAEVLRPFNEYRVTPDCQLVEVIPYDYSRFIPTINYFAQKFSSSTIKDRYYSTLYNMSDTIGSYSGMLHIHLAKSLGSDSTIVVGGSISQTSGSNTLPFFRDSIFEWVFVDYLHMHWFATSSLATNTSSATNHKVENVGDMNLKTVWVSESTPKSTSISFQILNSELSAELMLSDTKPVCYLFNGYVSDNKLWKKYSRIKKMKFTVTPEDPQNKAYECIIKLADTSALQRIAFNSNFPSYCGKYEFEIQETYSGEVSSAALTEIIMSAEDK